MYAFSSTKLRSTVCALTFLWHAGNMEVAIEASIDPQLALSHTELLQVPIEGEGTSPVQPNNCQVAVYWEGRYILGGWREEARERWWEKLCVFIILKTRCLWQNKCVTFTECVDSSPVGGSAAHVIEAGSSQLIGGVWLETCRAQLCGVKQLSYHTEGWQSKEN